MEPIPRVTDDLPAVLMPATSTSVNGMEAEMKGGVEWGGGKGLSAED